MLFVSMTNSKAASTENNKKIKNLSSNPSTNLNLLYAPLLVRSNSNRCGWCTADGLSNQLPFTNAPSEALYKVDVGGKFETFQLSYVLSSTTSN